MPLAEWNQLESWAARLDRGARLGDEGSTAAAGGAQAASRRHAAVVVRRRGVVFTAMLVSERLRHRHAIVVLRTDLSRYRCQGTERHKAKHHGEQNDFKSSDETGRMLAREMRGCCDRL
jgi:hypothetical protein